MYYPSQKRIRISNSSSDALAVAIMGTDWKGMGSKILNRGNAVRANKLRQPVVWREVSRKRTLVSTAVDFSAAS